MRAMVGEGAVLGMLAALYLLGYEKVHRTEGMVYTTSTGRNMVRGKIVAAVTAGVALYLLLTGLTLGIYFVQWDYSGLWSASVSSQFNFLTDMMVRRPFLTWADFTVAQYLVACLALGGGLVVGMTLLAALCGTWCAVSMGRRWSSCWAVWVPWRSKRFWPRAGFGRPSTWLAFCRWGCG